MLRRSAALILFASTLAWSQASIPGCANLPRTPRTNPDEAAAHQDDKSFKQRLKDQFSSGCANVLLTTCWGDHKGGQPPENTSGAPESKPQEKAAPSEQPSATSTSKQDALAFPEDQSRRAQEAAQAEVSSSKQVYEPPAPADSSEMEVVEMKRYDPHQAEKDLEVGDFYYKRGNYKAATSRYQEALQLRPGSPLATFKLADAYEKHKELEQAAVYYSEYVRQYPDGAQVADARAALERLAPVVRANAAHLKEIEVAHHLQAGEQLLALKNYPQAVERFCDVATIAPENPRAMFRLAQAQEATGDFAAAYQNYQSYLKLDSDGPFAPAARREVRRLGPQVQQGRVTSPSSDIRP